MPVYIGAVKGGQFSVITSPSNWSILGYQNYHRKTSGHKGAEKENHGGVVQLKGYRINQEDLGFLSQFGHAHINPTTLLNNIDI